MSRAKSSGDNKKKPARVAAGPEAPGFARTLGENLGRFLRPLIPICLFFIAGAGFSVLLWRSFGAVSASGQSDTQPARDRLSEKVIRQAFVNKQRPVWISREDYEQVVTLGNFASGRSIFEPKLSHKIAEKLSESPWVERVQSVRLRYPSHMDIEIEWRKPAARVDRLMVLDPSGHVLNLMPDSPAVRDTPLISGVICGRTETGKPVREKELIEALGLLKEVKDVLATSPGQLKIATIMRQPSGQWLVITDRGPAVYWGSFTDDPPMDEPRTMEKKDLLRRRLCEIKDPSLLEYIKVYHAQAPVKPRAAAALTAEPSATSTGSTNSSSGTRTRR
ncbi:MAG TPA: hypothetical protein VEK08_04065 [Planctomycetota bacterium]|nr:hypothetical protein [Planctomycetota bacterium]